MAKSCPSYSSRSPCRVIPFGEAAAELLVRLYRLFENPDEAPDFLPASRGEPLVQKRCHGEGLGHPLQRDPLVAHGDARVGTETQVSRKYQAMVVFIRS